jgi:WD40 repeat protein
MVIHAYSIDNNKIEHVMSSGIRHRADDIGRELSGGNTSGADEVFHIRWITDLLPIPDMNLIASASIDSNMALWDMQTLKGRSLHRLGHKHPIYSLEW